MNTHKMLPRAIQMECKNNPFLFIITCINLNHSLGQFSRQQTDNIFLIFPRKYETTCMKMSKPIFWKNKKNTSKCHLLKFLRSKQSVNWYFIIKYFNNINNLFVLSEQ